jgi:hypothetical protein
MTRHLDAIGRTGAFLVIVVAVGELDNIGISSWIGALSSGNHDIQPRQRKTPLWTRVGCIAFDVRCTSSRLFSMLHMVLLRSYLAPGRASAAALRTASQPQPRTLHHDPHTYHVAGKTPVRQKAGLRGRASCGARDDEKMRRPFLLWLGQRRMHHNAPTLGLHIGISGRPKSLDTRAHDQCSRPLKHCNFGAMPLRGVRS